MEAALHIAQPILVSYVHCGKYLFNYCIGRYEWLEVEIYVRNVCAEIDLIDLHWALRQMLCAHIK